MTSKFARPIALAALVLSAGTLTAGTATATAPTAPEATAVAGSVEVCIPIPVLPIEVSICL